MKGGKIVENLFLFGQTFQLMAIGVIVLAFGLGIIFFIWSLRLIKKIELLIGRMKKDIDSLENLSQSIYETAYQEMKKEVKVLAQKQSETNSEISQKWNVNPEKGNRDSTESSRTQLSRMEEGGKHQNLSELIVRHLKDLLQEKEQVTAQELVYDMPNDYSLADIYKALEEMKENNQVTWKEKQISPQSVLIMN